MFTYSMNRSSVFRRTDDEFGGLSNMSRSWPLKVYGCRVRTTEHLYQAMRFPEWPDIQQQILDTNKPKAAKLVAREYDEFTRVDWFDVRVDVMRWCLAIKLGQHVTRFGNLLDSTGDQPVVEFSKRDSFWGAAPNECGQLMGNNVLGQLLEELRASWRNAQSSGCLEDLQTIEPPPIPECRLLHLPVDKMRLKEDGQMPILLTSDEIYQLQLPGEPAVGHLAAWCRQQQINGKITSQDQAVALLLNFAAR